MLVLMSMLMAHTSLHFFVLSFVLACAYARVASEDQASLTTNTCTKDYKTMLNVKFNQQVNETLPWQNLPFLLHSCLQTHL